MATITQHHQFDAPPHAVFKALTDAPTLCTWWTTQAESDAVIGGAFAFEWRHTPAGLASGRHDLVQEGRYIECDVGTIQFPWAVGSTETTVRFVLNVQDGGTDIKLAHSGVPDDEATVAALTEGWTFFLQNLASVLGGGQDRRGEAGLIVGVAAPRAN